MSPVSKKLLVCVNDSEASRRVTRYVGQLIGPSSGFTVLLLHVLEPLPPQFQESRGAETTRGEERVEQELRQKQTRQIERSKQEAAPILTEAKSILTGAGVPAEAVMTDAFVPIHQENLATEILHIARDKSCGTVVTGRESFSWVQEIFRSHVSDELLEEGQGLAIWIVQ
jgi:nucleotide-binding universal stress UspA family protein